MAHEGEADHGPIALTDLIGNPGAEGDAAVGWVHPELGASLVQAAQQVGRNRDAVGLASRPDLVAPLTRNGHAVARCAGLGGMDGVDQLVDPGQVGLQGHGRRGVDCEQKHADGECRLAGLGMVVRSDRAQDRNAGSVEKVEVRRRQIRRRKHLSHR
jgi:hypothetical protein